MSEHRVTVKHDRDGDGEVTNTDITFECLGDRTSPCHSYPDCGCDEWSEEHVKEHANVPHDECWLQDWFDDGSCGEECYDHGDHKYHFASDLPEQSGPIKFDWDECITWSFIAEESK